MFKGRYKTVWTGPHSTLLTLEYRRLIYDPRISVERPFIDEWNLHIKSVTQTDQGQYTCQINTNPVRLMPVELVVTGTDLDMPTSSDKLEIDGNREEVKTRREEEGTYPFFHWSGAACILCHVRNKVTV
ncbi:cell adhesion molecule 2-like [Haliotis rubra]|uniref:cell adhesion molecule 2-like n=1 Tax=Haliotis rubra TaxID=36100 RepID=UPI001EE4FA2D|nr:cell adhesion molecule 2-like [Haliotis rubra]